MRVVILTVFTLISFAANSLLCRLALGNNLIDPVSFTTLRLLSGAFVLSIITLLLNKPTSPKRIKGSWTSGFALLIYAIAFSSAYISLHAGMGALILFGAVQITMIGVAIKSGEYLGPTQWIGTGIAIGGLIYLVFPGFTAPEPLGALLMCISGVSWGIYSVLGKGNLTPVATTAGNFMRAAPFAIIASVVAFSAINLEPYGLLLSLISGIITSGLGYILWYKVLRSLTTTQASVVQLLVPVLAAFGGVAFLAERVTMRLFFSSLLILGGVTLAVKNTSLRSIKTLNSGKKS